MTELNLNIDFSRTTNHIDFIDVFAPAHDLIEGDTMNILIVFPKAGRFLHSDYLLIVASSINFFRDKKIKVNITLNGENSYASRVNFYRLIGVDYKENYIRKSGAGRFIELKSFDQYSIYDLQSDLNLILYQINGVSVEVLQLIFYCLGEIMDNIIVHSGLNTGWFAAQYYPRSKEIRLIICDHGYGIYQSLTSNPASAYRNIQEYEALELCIQRGVTNGKGLGFGLYATSQFAAQNKGNLLIYSGCHYLDAKDGEITIKEGPFWKGTLVALRINTEVIVEYKSIMPKDHTLPDDYQFFIDKYFGENDDLW